MRLEYTEEQEKQLRITEIEVILDNELEESYIDKLALKIELQFLQGYTNGYDEPIAHVEDDNGNMLEIIFDKNIEQYSMTIYDTDGNPTRPYYNADSIEELLKEIIIEENQQKITTLWNAIIDMLPTRPRSFDTSDDPGFWTNGEEIFCPSEATMEMVYEFLNDIFREFGNYTLITGWYDPEEDANSGEQDDCTGFNYVRLE